jgi:hypothetical protein
MHSREFTIPELGLVAATRAILGAGVGLLLAGRLSADARKALGWGFVVVGALTTIPLALEVFGKERSPIFEHGDRPLFQRT